MSRKRNQLHILSKSFECAAMSREPKEGSTPPEMYDASDEASNFSSDGECWRIREKQGIDSLKEKNPTNTASETQDKAANSYVVTKTEDSPEDAAAKALVEEYMNKYAKALVEEYMNKYASVYCKELLFAIDVMTLVRYLNRLDCRYIIYATSGIAPISPCDDILDQALRKLWTRIENQHGDKLKAAIQIKGMNYRLFQKLILQIASSEEEVEWADDKSFLAYCLVLAQSAVYAEIDGIKDAPEFIPLVICRTIQNRKNSGQFPVDFWERIPVLALNIINGIIRL